MSRQADNAITFSFDSPKSVDLNAIQSAITADPTVQAEAAAVAAKPADQEQAASEEITQVVATEPADKSAQPSPTKETPQAEELQTFKITVDGQELEVTEADLKAGHMRHRDYTQKTQAVAAEKQAVEAERKQWAQEKAAIAQELSAIDQFLRDQQAMDAYYAKAFGVQRGQPVQMPIHDPNKPLTAADVAEIARYNAEQVRIHNERQLAEVRQETLKTQQAFLASQAAGSRRAAEAEVDTHISTLLTKYPVLRRFEGIEDELMGEAARYMPTDRKGTLEDAKARLSDAADRRMATIRAIAEDEKKQAAVTAAQLKKTTPEGSGGTAPRQAAPRKLTLNASDRKDFLAAAEADLRSIMGQTS